MYGNAYQNGPCFEVWDSKVNVDKNPFYKQLFKGTSSNIKKYFDKQVKSYLYSIHGQTSRMILPGEDHKQLALHQKYLVLHVHIPIGESWSLQIGITDINNFKRRINLTTVQGKQQVKYFSLRYPLDYLEKGNWVFLAINVYSFMEAFKQTVFRSLDHITVGSNCRLRRIFTMKEWNNWEIPKNFWFSSQVPQEFQLIQYKEQFLPKIGGNSKNMHLSEPVNSLYEKLTPKKIESKIILGKSEIYPNQSMAKSKLYNHNQNQNPFSKSPNKAVSLQPITVSKKIQNSKIDNHKIRLNSMKDEGMIIMSPQIRSSIHEKKTILKLSNKKKPLVQKSFQEDEILPPRGQSDLDFDTSNPSNLETKEEKREQRKIEKWSDEEENQFNQENLNINLSDKPVRTIISKQNNEAVIKVERKQINGGEQVQLIFDEMVGCYYHPETNTYFQIKN